MRKAPCDPKGNIDFQNTVVGWRYVFGIATALYFAASLVFTIFGSGETASWALTNSEKKAPFDGSENGEVHKKAVC